MNLLEPIFGAIIAWTIPRVLELWASKSKKENQEQGSAASKAFPWANWCLALTLGGAVGGALSGVLVFLSIQSPGDVANWTAVGVALGISQWWVLQRYLGIGPFWAVGSALGWSLAPFFRLFTLNPFWVLAAIGVAVGLFQFFLLKRVRHAAFWWIPANMAAWLLGGAIGWATMGQLTLSDVSPQATWIIGWAVAGLMGALVLGFALSRLQPK